MRVRTKKPEAKSLAPVISKKKAVRVKKTGRGASLLSEAAGKALEENSGKITKSLVDSAIKGNASSAKLLVSLAERSPNDKKEKTKRQSRSLARKLATEPEWSDEDTGIRSPTIATSQITAVCK
jgi:hypothetical protein